MLRLLDALLQAEGFMRRKSTWNRVDGDYVDVLDLQASKDGESVTVNAGILDTVVHNLLWGQSAPSFVAQPTCTIAIRIGDLLDGKDRWWTASDELAPGAIAASVEADVLPFFRRMRSREMMEQWLRDSDVTRRQHPPPILALAILMHLNGRPTEGCATLRDLSRGTSAAWKERVSDVARRLDCP